MKKLIKGLGILILVLLLLFVGIYLMYNQPLPKGETGAKATALAQKMQQAINQTAWDSTRYVEWTFIGSHHFVWDKERHLVQVKWGDYRVLLNPNKIEGIAYENGQKIDDPSIIKKANSLFINDAFWLNAPAQMAGNRDVKLEAVDLEGNKEGLLITYPSRGDTPGDAYLWILDENGLPTAWQMWVKVVPIGGLEFSWEEWTTLATGAKIATKHQSLLNIPITNLKSYQVAAKDIFSEMK